MRDKQSDNIKYIGRTNDPVRRQQEHNRDETKNNLKPLEVVASGLSVDGAQKIEQLLISTYTLIELQNKRREISVKRIPLFASVANDFISLQYSVLQSEVLCLMER